MVTHNSEGIPSDSTTIYMYPVVNIPIQYPYIWIWNDMNTIRQ